MPKSSIEFESTHIRFLDGGRVLSEQPLDVLERAYTAFCFNPEVAPTDNTSYNVLEFGDTLWVVPEEAASRHISGGWAEQLATHGGFFYAESGILPKNWRRPYLLIARHPYYPKAVVVPKQALPFTKTSDRIDPRYLAEYNQRYVMQQLKA